MYTRTRNEQSDYANIEESITFKDFYGGPHPMDTVFFLSA